MSVNAYVNDRTYRRNEFDSDGSPEPVLRLPRQGASSPNGILLSRAQIFLFWSAIAGMMVFVFVVGFHAGRGKGREALLEEVSREAVRLPIVSPIAVANSGSERTSNSQAVLDDTNAQNAAALDEGDTTFDFGGSVALSKQVTESEKVVPSTQTPKVSKQLDQTKTPADGTKVAPGWYIQVEAAKNLSEVTNIEKIFAAKGFKPVVHRGKLRDQIYYQVILGPYETRDSALSARKKVKRSKLSRIEPFVRRF